MIIYLNKNKINKKTYKDKMKKNHMKNRWIMILEELIERYNKFYVDNDFNMSPPVWNQYDSYITN